MNNDKQLFQIQNILETLIEATDQLSEFIKIKDLNKSVYLFTSIVEGSQSVINVLNKQHNNLSSETRKLEKILVMITNELEQRKFTKISEIIQFSMRPLLIRITQSFVEELGNFKKEKEIKIGVFHSSINPRNYFSKERMQATLQEASKQHTKLYFFTSSDIDFDKQTIDAETYTSDNWKRVHIPFPDVVNNVGAGIPSQEERKLQRIIPFTGFFVGNKFTLPLRLLRYKKFADLLVPFIVCHHPEKIHQFIEQHHHVVFKALKSNRGENIFFVNKKNNKYVMIDQKKQRILSDEEFQQFVDHTIIAEKGSYIIQRYIHTRTKADEPYHFRSHVQKDRQGKWNVVHIYPRIGHKKSNLSNISTEGRVEDFPLFLRHEFGEKQGANYERKILTLSMDVVQHLDKLYGFGLNELGLDFAIDDKGRIWMHEANNGPETAYHEEKRAINYIGYAKYIAENGIMHTSQSQQAAEAKGQFRAQNTDLPLFNENTPTIGILIAQRQNDLLSRAVAIEAEKRGIPLYFFTPMDIDYNLGLIRSSFFEDGQWVARVTTYPNVIIDHLKLRSVNKNPVVYQELADIPFTNIWGTDAAKRSWLYQQLRNCDEMADYQSIRRPLHVFQFLDKYGVVQLRQEDMSHLNYVYTIRQVNEKMYEVIYNSTKKNYTWNELRNFINHLIERKPFIVQQYCSHDNNTYTEIHSHVMKGENNEWKIVSNHVERKMLSLDSTVQCESKSLSEWNENEFKDELNDLSIHSALILEGNSNLTISEISLIYSVNPEDGSLIIMDVNPSGPSSVYDNELYSKAVIDLAMNKIKK